MVGFYEHGGEFSGPTARGHIMSKQTGMIDQTRLYVMNLNVLPAKKSG
jgi:hypothetical protein